MPFAEVIYETGSKSVISIDSEEEALAGLEEHQRRAKNGEAGGPTGHAAERIKSVLVYDEHPADLNASGLMPVEEVKTEMLAALEESSMGGQVSVMELAAKLRSLTDPHVPNAGRHESQYKAKAARELSGSWAGGE